MAARDRRKRRSREGKRGEPERVPSAAAVWGRTVVGLAMAVSGGAAFGYAWTSGDGLGWWIGGLTLLLGVLLVLWAISSRSAVQPAPSRATRQQLSVGFPCEREPLVPLLGALLVYKYQVISHEQLSLALEKQLNEHGGKRQLGRILIEMGLVTEQHLQKALEQQRLYARVRGEREEQEAAAAAEESPQGE